MKELKLTIHPRLEDTNLNADDIRMGRATERRMAQAKRLTDAETAAEYFAAELKARDLRRTPYSEECIRQADILQRFATLPDGLEAS